MVLNSKFKTLSALELFKSIPNAKYEWKSKTPMQKWCYFYSIGKVPFSIAHLPLFKEDQNDVHWFGCFSLANSTIAVLLSLYTIWYHQVHGEAQISLVSTCLTGIIVGVRKFWTLNFVNCNSINNYAFFVLVFSIIRL